MKLITLNIPEHADEKLKEAVKRGYASDRSVAIRDAIRDYLQLHEIW